MKGKGSTYSNDPIQKVVQIFNSMKQVGLTDDYIKDYYMYFYDVNIPSNAK